MPVNFSFSVLARSYQTHGQNRSRSHDSTWSQGDFSGDPALIFNQDRLCLHIKRFAVPSMTSRTKICALRYAAVRSNRNLIEIVYPYSFTNPTVIANRQLPRKFHAHTWFYNHPLTYVGPKKPQKSTAPTRTRQPRGEGQPRHNCPERLYPDGPTAFKVSR